MSSVIDVEYGRAYVITDLHGEAEPYLRYRDHFLSLFHRGEASTFIILGDVIHGYGEEASDKSVDILVDIMRLNDELGTKRVIMALGNHELPHIYGVTLSKGNLEFTRRFEAAMGSQRVQIIEFLKRLPFIIRTPSGVLLTHAGPTASITTADAASKLVEFSHDALISEADRLLNRGDVIELIRTYLSMSIEEYDANARYYLAVTGPNDPRYFDLLRGLIVSNLEEWQQLWDFFFNQGEVGLGQRLYRSIINRFCQAFSNSQYPQRVIVTGHMSARDGISLIGTQQLRLASWAHSVPKEAGRYLLFDVESPLSRAEDLLPSVHPMP